MKSTFKDFVTICVFFVLLGTLPLVARAQQQKIRVVVENASIRMKPDIQSEHIRKPPLGSIFTVHGKVGEWYELKVPIEIGVLVTGYIHEMYVELTAERDILPEPEIEVPKKPRAPETPTPPPEPREKPETRIEFAIRGAYTTGYSINSQSYSDSFSAGVLQNASATGTFTFELEKPWGFDGSFSYFFIGGLGIQLRFDYNRKSNFLDTSKSTYNLNWNWTTGRSGSEQEEWPMEGDVTLMIISGNLVYKIKSVEIIAPYFSGGASYYSGKLNATTTGAYAVTWVDYLYRYIDYFDIPVNLDKSFSGIGFNAGVGLDIIFSRNVGLSMEARYFFLTKVKENWEVEPGVYDGNLQEGWTLTINAEEAKVLQEEIDLLEFNSSFFKFSAGFKFMF